MNMQTKQSKPNYLALAIIFIVIGLIGFILAQRFLPAGDRLPESLFDPAARCNFSIEFQIRLSSN